MFVTLLAVTFVVSIASAAVVTLLFRKPARKILERILSAELAGAWLLYLIFAIYVVGVSGGVRIWELEKYITGRGSDGTAIVLNTDRWILEVYRTIVSTLQSVAWLLLVFFVFTLIAYVIVRSSELKRPRDSSPNPTESDRPPS